LLRTRVLNCYSTEDWNLRVPFDPFEDLIAS
jgi:hypothetical protein